MHSRCLPRVPTLFEAERMDAFISDAENIPKKQKLRHNYRHVALA